MEVVRPADLESSGLQVDQTIDVETQSGLGLQDESHRSVDPLLLELTLLDAPNQRLNGHPEVGRHQDHIGAGSNRVHRGLSDPGQAHALHFHGIGHDEAPKTHLVAEDLAVEGGGERRGTTGWIEGRYRHMAYHDRVHPRGYRLSEGRPFHRLQVVTIDTDDRQIQVAVDGGIAVPRKVLGRREQAALAGAPDECGTQPGDQLRVFPERPNIDHRIVRVAVDVQHRSEGPVDSERPSLPGRHLSKKAGRLLGARGAHGHRIGQINASPSDTEGQAALHIHRHQQRDPSLGLELVEQTRDGPFLRPHQNQPSHTLVPNGLDELEGGLRPRVPGVAGLRDHHHLGRLLFEAHSGQGRAHPLLFRRRQLRPLGLLPESGNGCDEDDQPEGDDTRTILKVG